MTDSTTLGHYLRRERECRGLALRTISENTKVSLSLLEGLEADDISRWPGGIFRRAFVRSYAQCVGLDGDDVMRRFDQQFPADGAVGAEGGETAIPVGHRLASHQFPQQQRPSASSLATRFRLLGTAADLAVAVVLAFGSAAAGSRLLWPVLLIAAYYAVGVLMTGTSPMVALLTGGDLALPTPTRQPHAPKPPKPSVVASEDSAARVIARHATRRSDDAAVGQRPGMQAPI